MAAYSPRAAAAVERFAASVGLAPRPARDGTVSFLIAGAGLLTLTPAEDGDRLLVSLAWAPDRPRPEDELALLACAGRNPSTGRYTHAGIAPDDSFVLTLAIEDAEVDLPALDETLRALTDLRAGFP
ncbi:CesT family type III secretion system chaperone [Prosthecomicrobium sp. N25]|uniref:CesT family type III secretion system chaperone n=1 Tax=Prosthecomicrobium sp. N25 TaxID=3129254 RepID=UPI003078755E